MFLGHFAIALAAKRATPNTSLGTLFAAAQLVDLLWPMFLLLGMEHVAIVPGITTVTPLDFWDYPITHSLVGSIGWAVLFGVGVYLRTKNRSSALVVGSVVASHWFLDLLMHQPDLPLTTNTSAKLGFGMWNNLPLTFLCEFGLFFLGVAIYMRTTTAIDNIGRWGLLTLLGSLGAIYLASVFGPPPPNAQSIAIAGNATWLFVAWAWWTDRHRGVR